ncbi:LRR domain containing protein [Parasponia andersonii]|uniref:LRR domain containing protein n=1 Tax=Parasponia andersonii TaxID=3476 RepID=A0A2P5CIJ9_PARAD|nr:LRR domain containing protein [Parasponia andersonii]
MMKSVETYYERIQKELAIIDLASNKFSGEIPSFVGNLTALYSLNLSNNMLDGRIPSTVAVKHEEDLKLKNYCPLPRYIFLLRHSRY